jgi:hypothetical protein
MSRRLGGEVKIREKLTGECSMKSYNIEETRKLRAKVTEKGFTSPPSPSSNGLSCLHLPAMTACAVLGRALLHRSDLASSAGRGLAHSQGYSARFDKVPSAS